MTAVERHRAQRHLFSAHIELTDVQSEKSLTAQIKDLSLFGCAVETNTPFPEGTKVRLRIVWGGATVAGLANVANSYSSRMGLRFSLLEPGSMATLEEWLSRLRH